MEGEEIYEDISAYGDTGTDVLLEEILVRLDTPPVRRFAETPLEEFSVTEGLLLIAVCLLLVDMILGKVRRWF